MALENSMLVMNGKQVGGNTQDLTGYQTKVDNNLETESNEIAGAINELRSEKADTDMVASDFDATASYTEGNYCIYEGKFYKFKTSHSGAWSAADVDEIKIAGELSALKSGLISSIVLSIYGTHDVAPFEENATGVIFAIKDNDTVLGYLVVRPKGYLDDSNRPIAIELYNSSWQGIWGVTRV